MTLLDPGRQQTTTGWWGWFPNIPRNVFGRVWWLIVVGAVTAGFAYLAGAIVWGLVSTLLGGTPGSAGGDASGDDGVQVGDFSWPDALVSVYVVLLCVVGVIAFGYALYTGAQQARIDAKRKRELDAYVQSTETAVENARRRLMGRNQL